MDNTQGVVVKIESMSGLSQNSETNGFIVEDIGSLTLNESHLAKFKDGEELFITLVRGNITISNEESLESHKTGVISSTIWSGSLKK